MVTYYHISVKSQNLQVHSSKANIIQKEFSFKIFYFCLFLNSLGNFPYLGDICPLFKENLHFSTIFLLHI